MTEFKVGDVVENVSDYSNDINVGKRYTITSVSGSLISFNDCAGDPRTRTSIRYKLISRPSETPPTTITHEGYTYTRGERVRPEWLKDGAWVVSKKGVLRKVWDDGENGAYLTSDKKQDILYTEELRDQYRPHETSDYKWGDWAMYEGKKVFVISKVDDYGLVVFSHADFRCGYEYESASKLTPTHAP